MPVYPRFPSFSCESSKSPPRQSGGEKNGEAGNGSASEFFSVCGVHGPISDFLTASWGLMGLPGLWGPLRASFAALYCSLGSLLSLAETFPAYGSLSVARLVPH